MKKRICNIPAYMHNIEREKFLIRLVPISATEKLLKEVLYRYALLLKVWLNVQLGLCLLDEMVNNWTAVKLDYDRPTHSGDMEDN